MHCKVIISFPSATCTVINKGNSYMLVTYRGKDSAGLIPVNDMEKIFHLIAENNDRFAVTIIYDKDTEGRSHEGQHT